MINYLLWFLEVAAVVLPILLAGLLLWLLFRRRQRANGKVLPPLSPLRMIFMLALAGDILITLLLTLVSRPVRVSFQPYPLASWIEAWNCWTRPLFEQLFLNVAVFLPFGGLLALTFPALRRLPRIAGLSFAFSLCIECLQLLFRRGVFDADDLLCNTVGGLLGGAIICLVLRLYAGSPKSALTAALPLLSAGLCLAFFFGAYAAQPYGNLRIAPSHPLSMRGVTVTAAPLPLDAPTEAAVYRPAEKNADDAEAVFARVRRALSLPDNCGEITVYPTAIDWQYSDAGLSLTYSLAGGSWYLHHAPGGSCPAPTMTDNLSLSAWLSDFGLPVADAYIHLRDDGTWSVAPRETRLLPTAPRILCSFFADGGWTLDVRLTEYREVGILPILSPTEALDAVRTGRFLCTDADFSHLSLTALTLTYYTDSKGFSQPVWQFSAAFDGRERPLLIPARK